MPENTYFRQADTQAMMLDILFVFCKLNPDIGYRQGMHELLAPLLWIVQADAVRNGSSADDFMLCQLCDSRFIEHDTFTLFSIVMQNAKSFYEQAAHPVAVSSHLNKSPATTLENPIITRVNKIFNDYLPHLDPELSTHLHSIEIIPQVFLMRWIRLLFGREFAFDDVLQMWDVIFAEDPSLQLVDMICLTMILNLRWQLLDADYNGALILLLKYNTPEDSPTPQELTIDAVNLMKDFTRERAQQLIEKYSGRPVDHSTTLPDPDDFALDPTSQPSTITNSNLEPKPNTRRIVTPTLPRNVESMLQDAAKGVYDRGEKWGINKAVRDAVEEVRRGVRDMQTLQTPQLPPRAPRRHSRTQSRTGVLNNNNNNDILASGASSRQFDTGARLMIVQQQRRNETLARMLRDATARLWEFQREAAEAHGKMAEETVKGLGMAIARVQFVQVYLEDASIPLAEEEEEEQEDKEEGAGVGNEPGAEEKSTDAARSPSTIMGKERSSGRTDPPKTGVDIASPPDDSDSTAIEQIANSSSKLPATEQPSSGSEAVAEPTQRPPPRPSSSSSSSSAKETQNPSDTTASPQQLTNNKQQTPAKHQPSRPTLAQSSFSWMLGQEDRSSPSTSSPPSSSPSLPASSLSPSLLNNFVQSTSRDAARVRSRGFLFGEEVDGGVSMGRGMEGGEKGGGSGGGGGDGSKAKRGKDRKPIRRTVRADEVEHDDGFDLSTLKQG